jgi:hypothetical protein
MVGKFIPVWECYKNADSSHSAPLSHHETQTQLSMKGSVNYKLPYKYKLNINNIVTKMAS